MKNIRTLALGAVLAIGISSVAGAQSTQGMEKGKPPVAHEGRKHEGDRGMRDHGMSRKRMRGHALKGVNLTDAQKEQVKSINARYRSELEALRPKGRADGVRPDSAARAQMMSKRMEIERRQMAEVRAVLTAEQRITFDANVAKMHEKASDWREKHGEKGSKKGR